MSGEPSKDGRRTFDASLQSKTLNLVYKVDTPKKKLSKQLNIEKLAESFIENFDQWISLIDKAEVDLK